MEDLIKKEYKEKVKNNFYENEYWDWVTRKMLSAGPLSGKDIYSIQVYIKTQQYSMLTSNAIRVLLYCIHAEGELNG